MTVASFRRCVALKELKDGDRQWLPKWLSAYAKFHGVQGEDVQLEMDEARVIAFLRSLRDRNVEAWRRLQAMRAMRAMELYQQVILRTPHVDFLPIRKKLMGDIIFTNRRLPTTLIEHWHCQKLTNPQYHIRCAIVLRHICWRMVPIYEQYRSC